MTESPTRLSWEAITLNLHHPFRLSMGVSTTRTAHWIRLTGDEGWGEGTIPPYYNISDDEMRALWDGKSHSSVPFPNDPEDIPQWVGDQGPAPARAALDLALHDRIGRSRGIPLFRLFGLPAPEPLPTAFTIAIDEPDAMAEKAAKLQDYPVIKLKLGSEDDIVRVAAVRRARPDVRLYLDANAGWTADEAKRLINELARFKIELVEQPVAGPDIEGMGYVQSGTEIPIVADESITSMRDLEDLARAGVKGINLKIMKLGGLAPTLRMLKRGKELGFKVMLGCMTETSLGVTAMSHLASLADWIDLDAPLLISNDPFRGVCYDKAIVSLPDRPGIGIVHRSAHA